MAQHISMGKIFDLKWTKLDIALACVPSTMCSLMGEFNRNPSNVISYGRLDLSMRFYAYVKVIKCIQKIFK